jgi:hypothetical protein
MITILRKEITKKADECMTILFYVRFWLNGFAPI